MFLPSRMAVLLCACLSANSLSAADSQALPVRDFDGDSDSDILLRQVDLFCYVCEPWRNGSWSLGRWELLQFSGLEIDASTRLDLFRSLDWHYQDMADFDADGDADVLARHADHGYRIFLTEAISVGGNVNPGLFVDQSWVFEGSGDFDSDGDHDVVLRNHLSGAWRLFEMQGSVSLDVRNLALFRNQRWRWVGSIDFDDDGDDDVVLRDSETGAWRLFTMQNGSVSSVANLPLPKITAWVPQALGVFHSDGVPGMLVRSSSTTAWRTMRLVDGRLEVSSPGLPTDAGFGRFGFVQAGDFDGDGDYDVVLEAFGDPNTHYLFEMQDGLSLGGRRLRVSYPDVVQTPPLAWPTYFDP